MNIIDNFSRALTETDSQKAQYLKDQLRQIGTTGFNIEPNILFQFDRSISEAFLAIANDIIEVKQDINAREIYQTNKAAEEIDNNIKELEKILSVENLKISGIHIQSFTKEGERYISISEALSIEIDKALTAMQQLHPEQWDRAVNAIKSTPDLYQEAQKEVLLRSTNNKGEDEIIKEAYKILTQKKGEVYLEQLRSGKDQTLLDILKELIRRIVEKINPDLAIKIASSQEASTLIKDQIKRIIINKENVSYTLLDNTSNSKIDILQRSNQQESPVQSIATQIGKATLHENIQKSNQEQQYSSKLSIDKSSFIKAIQSNPQSVINPKYDAEGKITSGTIQVRVEYTGESNICNINIQSNPTTSKTISTEYTALLDINSTIQAIDRNDSIHLLPVKQYNNGVDMAAVSFKRGEDNRINYQERVTLGVARTDNPSRVNLSHININPLEFTKAIHNRDNTRIQALLESPKMTKELYDSMKSIKSVKDNPEISRLFHLQETRFSREQDNKQERKRGIKL